MASKSGFFSGIKLTDIIPIAVVIGAVVAFKKIFPGDPNSDKRDETQKTLQDEIAKKKQQGQQPSFSDSQYKSWADTLEAAMFDVGTDEDSIQRVIQYMKIDLDVLKLAEAFGVRAYYFFGNNQGDYNLGQWFNQELSDSALDEYVNAPLREKKISYQF